MSALPDFISELVRAANEVGRINPFEVERLLLRAVRTINDARDEIGVRPDANAFDQCLESIRVAREIGEGGCNVDDMSAALLNAADMIRTLKIVLDAKDKTLRDI